MQSSVGVSDLAFDRRGDLLIEFVLEIRGLPGEGTFAIDSKEPSSSSSEGMESEEMDLEGVLRGIRYSSSALLRL